ncbi:MAG TPA: glucose 1-dehydrogenase [Bryobacteraceae bacterium]|nr:glucose 1-dehydrogenase [Bryobacteraceae bacterium]
MHRPKGFGGVKAGAVFPAQRRVEIVEVEEPKIASSTQVKLRILEVGVCGTDREICQFHHGTTPEGSEFLVLGHESLAEVVETGPEVRRVRRGDLVVPRVRLPCRHAACAACRGGQPDFCTSGDFVERGIKQAHGFMTDFVVDEEEWLNPVPRELRDVAILVEPLTIAEKTLAEMRAIQQRLPFDRHAQRAVVLGAGPIGLLGAMALVNAGFETHIYSRELPPNPRADVAAAIGATYVSSQVQTVEQLARTVGNIDVVYEAIGASQTAFDLLEVLGANGLFCFTGVPRHGQPISVHMDRLLYNLVLKNQAILGAVNAGRDAFEASVRDLGVFYQRWPEAVRSLITGRYALEDFREPILQPSGIKNIVVLDGTN